jgi:tubulin epsilon
MECGPLQETMRGPLGSLFEETQYVMDVYGAGNNFANGHYIYGPQYRWKRNADFSRFSVAFFPPFSISSFFPHFFRCKFEESLRKSIEHCDSLQTFFVLHSLGGGTGSGVGSYIVSMLEDLYPDVYRFSTCTLNLSQLYSNSSQLNPNLSHLLTDP